MNAFWVGEMPSRPLSIRVYDSKGQYVNLANYSEVRLVIVDSENNPVDLAGSVVELISPETGTLNFTFPSNRSVFDEPGEYLLQVELYGNGTLDFTSTQTFYVQQRGRLIS